MTKHWKIACSSLLAALAMAPRAEAKSFVTIHDDGTLSGSVTSMSPDVLTKKIVAAYTATGAPIPDVISIWTTFPMDKNDIETLCDPVGQDAQGIGMDTVYGGNGTFKSTNPPLRAILMHNDFTTLAARAAAQNAPVEGFGQYLFLLELTHVWGPAAAVPTMDGGVAAGALIGFTYHWSFWMDNGGSPAGGNAWVDNGDGTFTTSGGLPSTVKYSMLDLYLMGLASPSEVTPIHLIANGQSLGTEIDPFTHKAYSPTSFPWFGSAPFVAKGTKLTFTVDDIIAANGPRVPATEPSTLKLGIVLDVSATATDEDVANFEAQFEPFAATLAPAYHTATSTRGTLDVVTASADAADAGVDATPGDNEPVTTSSGGCSMSGGGNDNVWAAWLGVLGLVAARRRRGS
jgi:MYXO-CTERM domain-containing protein